jgi:hypothetical protein
MLGKITKLMIIVAIASWAISNSTLQECTVFSTSDVLGADRNTGPVLKAGQKTWIGDEYYFVYDFDKKPQMGTIIMKVQVFTKSGNQDSSVEITGSADMPSMKGAHSTGEQPFKLNKKGDYLLPVNVVMPGEWEVVLNFFKDKKPIYTGSVRFNV